MAPLGPFDPPIGRQSSVVVLSRRFNDSWGDYRLVTTISTRSSTEVLEINSSSGYLLIAADHSFTDEVSRQSPPSNPLSRPLTAPSPPRRRPLPWPISLARASPRSPAAPRCWDTPPRRPLQAFS